MLLVFLASVPICSVYHYLRCEGQNGLLAQYGLASRKESLRSSGKPFSFHSVCDVISCECMTTKTRYFDRNNVQTKIINESTQTS
jgi:hypothetical protein